MANVPVAFSALTENKNTKQAQREKPPFLSFLDGLL